MAADQAPELLEDDPLVEDEPPPLSQRVLANPMAQQLRARSAMLRCTLAAVAAWAITLAPLILAGRASLLTRTAATLALIPALGGPQLLLRRHGLARHLGVTAFLVLALATWSLASHDAVLGGVDGFRGVLGAFAWGVFALSWSHPWSVPDRLLTAAPEGATIGLAPRRRPPAYAAVVVLIGLLCALGCLVVAWTIEEGERAVLGQALAVACAVALVTSASTVAVMSGRTQRDGKPSLPLNRKVANTLLLLLVVLGCAVALHLAG